MSGVLSSVKWVVGLGSAALLMGACAVESAPTDDGSGQTSSETAGQSKQKLCVGYPDCGGDTGYCGDGECGYHETCSNCAADCGSCCGNGVCNAGETPYSCPSDCHATCGNGICETGAHEYYSTCPHDCTSSNTSTGIVCGNGYCDYNEGCGGMDCPADCHTLCKPTDSSSAYSTTGVTSCSYKCQDCSGYYWSGYSWVWYDGACNTNSFGGLYCEFDNISCYTKWQCCVF